MPLPTNTASAPNCITSAASAGVAWGAGALLYYVGYSKGPEQRYSYGGGVIRIASLALQILPFVTAYKMLH